MIRRLAAILGIVCSILPAVGQPGPNAVRQVIFDALVAPTAEAQKDIILTLRTVPTAEAVTWFEKWKGGQIFLTDAGDGTTMPVLLTGKQDAGGTFATLKFLDDMPFTLVDGSAVRIDPKETEAADTSSSLRRAMKEVADLVSLADPDLTKRIRAIQDSAIGQKQEKLPSLELLRTTEKNSKAIRALNESIAIIKLRSPVPDERVAACITLGNLKSLASFDTIKTILAEAKKSNDKATIEAAQTAIAAIEVHISSINAMGTAFRGISLGSVLLVVAIGLAITFGLMGIINMAHGEFIAVGAYTTYVLQNVFGAGLNLSPFGQTISIPGFNLSATGMNFYFVAALPAAFLTAALVGILLERSVIRFLYRRPLESLLATWGVSLVLQQSFRMVFGSNNVQVTSPVWLSGNWTINDVVLGWNRVFVIAFAVVIVLVTWLVLNRTSLGLLIRAVMQNRNMAACMGVRTERVNMLTFAFGCGLAGLAGAFLSQIGNVGPSLGQSYIVDAFMTVVVGGVGNILGTVISAVGIGMADQSLQQYLGNPVIGKILVLGAIILFLQWRPAGIFVTRSRTLD